MAISVFDLFKIGIGPSSSHTVGPMYASRRLAETLATQGLFESTTRVKVDLYGSLGATGKGHGSDKAVMLGLAGHAPDTVYVNAAPQYLATIRERRTLSLLGHRAIAFNEKTDLMFNRRETLPLHSNGMRFRAFDAGGTELLTKIYYSVGGGFVVTADADADGATAQRIAPDTTLLPHAFRTGEELLRLCKRENTSIAEIMRRNERHWRTDPEIDAGLLQIWRVMQSCVNRGCMTQGVLPGGYKVKRRAPALYQQLATARGAYRDELIVLDWVNLYALAVNEENAAGGRVVTAPTNGAAGIIPAVLHYYRRFIPSATDAGIVDFLLTAAAIGILYKEHASISGAEVGCQGEVGGRARWRPVRCVLCSAAHHSRRKTQPRSAWSIISA